MISTTQDWKDYSSEIGTFHIKATLNNGTTLNLTDADFMQGSVSVTDSVSGMGEFTIGSVITNSFNATLNNFEGKFNTYQLAGATIAVQFGIIYEDSTEEWIDRGIYTIEKPNSMGSTIKIVGYDDMDKLNRYYIGKDVNGDEIEFPISAATFAETLCDYCGVTFGSWNLDSANISEFEYNESTTCRQVLSWLVQIFGGYARVNNIGGLECNAFTVGDWVSGDNLDGGVINPWETVDSADGGTIQPWSAVTDFSGGWTNGGYTLSKIKSLDVYIEDITITGIRAYVNGTVDEFQFETVGENGYVLGIQDNPFITSLASASTVANRVAGKVKGLMFRPFDASIFGDPSIEAGDNILLRDYLGKEHPSLITSLTYQLNSAERLECNAETPTENANAIVNPATSIVQGAVTAAYDYITAKKINAEDIKAGTLGVNGTITTNDLQVLNGSKLGGFNITGSKIQVTYTVPHTYTASDYQRIQQIILGTVTPTAADYNTLDVTGDGEITALDYVIVKKSVDDYNGVLSTTITIDPSSYISGFSATNNIGSGTYIGASSVRTPNCKVGSGVFSVINCSGTVTATQFINSSKEEIKRDIEKADSALSKVLNADILTFNFKREEKGAKKHIGLAIGEDYNTPSEVIALDEDGKESGVDLYAMVAMAWKAIQEQQEQIETLQSEIAELKEKINGNTDQKR